MEFNINYSYKAVNEDIQGSLSDSDLLQKAAELEAKKNEAKKTLDSAQDNYNKTIQQIDQQMVQLINLQAQRNSQQAKNTEPKAENESSLNEDSAQKIYRVLLDDFLPRVLGLAYDGNYIMKLCNKAGLRCYDDEENGLTVVLTNPGDLGVLYQIMDDNYLDERDYENAILSQLPGEFTRAFYSGDY